MNNYSAPLLSDFINGSTNQEPADAGAAHKRLNAGNIQFASWVNQQFQFGAEQVAAFERSTGLVHPESVAAQKPFSIVVSCSDARVPVRAALGQRCNDIFEVRVAGNVLADECRGSIDYALHHLESVKALVVLGHTHCGAVTAAADAFLRPTTLLSPQLSLGLRSIVQRLYCPLIEAHSVLSAHGRIPSSQAAASKRHLLIEAGIYIHAAMTAYDLQAAVATAGRSDVKVFYGCISLTDYLVRSPQTTTGGDHELLPGFSPAPASIDELEGAANRVAVAVVEPND